METRVAVLAVIVQEGSSVQALMQLFFCCAFLEDHLNESTATGS